MKIQLFDNYQVNLKPFVLLVTGWLSLILICYGLFILGLHFLVLIGG